MKIGNKAKLRSIVLKLEQRKDGNMKRIGDGR